MGNAHDDDDDDACTSRNSILHGNLQHLARRRRHSYLFIISVQMSVFYFTPSAIGRYVANVSRTRCSPRSMNFIENTTSKTNGPAMSICLFRELIERN